MIKKHIETIINNDLVQGSFGYKLSLAVTNNCIRIALNPNNNYSFIYLFIGKKIETILTDRVIFLIDNAEHELLILIK